MIRKVFLVAMLAAGLFLPSAAFAETLVVVVHGLRSLDGVVQFGLYDTAERFPTSAGKIRGGKAKVDGERVVFVFEDLEPGTYAVALFHDENANGKLDQGLLGVPLEGYGFSNDAKVALSPPSFIAAAFDVFVDTGRCIDIRVKY